MFSMMLCFIYFFHCLKIKINPVETHYRGICNQCKPFNFVTATAQALVFHTVPVWKTVPRLHDSGASPRSSNYLYRKPFPISTIVALAPAAVTTRRETRFPSPQ